MARLSLKFLGPLLVTLDGQPVRAAAYDKVWALLAVLAHSAGQAHSRDSLAALLWPEQPESAARTNLRQALARLRQAIGDPSAEPAFLLIDRETLQFNPASDFELDVAEFTRLCAECDAHAHRRREACLPCAQRHERAAALYRGRFLDQFFLPDSAAFEEWALLTREPLHRRALAALGQLADYSERRGAYDQARRYTGEQLALDPWREEAHRQLMRLLVLSGRRSEALVQYERCRSLLAAELGIEPAAETTALYERIRSADFDVRPAADLLALPAAHRHNLPLQPTPFVGREKELAALADLLASPTCRLITLAGPGGIGKTRLALQAAIEQLDAFPDGIAFVPLAPLSSPEFVVPAIAEALNLNLSGRGDPLAEVIAYLHARELLLILDNCEHLLAGAGHFADILQGAPGVTLLATSRERLSLSGEWLFEVQGLPVPDQASADDGDGAVALFMQTARRLRAGFAPAGAEQAAVVRICQLVAGMPLAVELAAAWVRLLSCAAIAAEIENSLGILAADLRDWPARHQSMRAVFDHSWKLLSPQEQQVFPYLSIFRGGFQREAADGVAGASLRVLSGLADKSLVSANPGGRYELHELARQYGAEKLEAAGEAGAASNRHLAYFLALAERAAPELTGPGQAAWLDQLEAEHDNLRAALACGQAAGDTERTLRLAGALWRFWFLRGHLLEGEQWLRRVLEQPGGPPTLRARALAGASFIAEFRGHYEEAAVWATESLALAREVGDPSLAALSLSLLGEANARMQGAAKGWNLLKDGLDAARASGDRWLVAFALAQLAQLPQPDPQLGSPMALAEESLALARTIGDRWLLALSLFRLANTATGRQDFAMAQALHQESLAIRRELGDRLGMAYALLGLANAAYAGGKIDEALARMQERLKVERELNNLEGITHVLNDMGWMHFWQDDIAGAVRCFEEGLALSRTSGYTWGVASLLDNLGQVTAAQRKIGQARAYYVESLAIYQQIRNEAGHGSPRAKNHDLEFAEVHTRIGQIDYLQGRLPEAREHLKSGLQIFRELNNVVGMGWVLSWLGSVEHRAGDVNQARARIESGLASLDPDGHWPELAFTLLSLGDVCRAEGNPARATELYRRSLTILTEQGVRPDSAQGRSGIQPDLAQYLEAFAKLAGVTAQPVRAARLLGAAQSLREQFGPAIPPVEQADYDRSVSQLRAPLDPAAFDAAWAEGQALGWEQAVAYALAPASPITPAPSAASQT